MVRTGKKTAKEKKTSLMLIGGFLIALIGTPCLAWEVNIHREEVETTYGALTDDVFPTGSALAFKGKDIYGLAVSEPFYWISLEDDKVSLVLGHKKHTVYISEKVKSNECLDRETRKHEEKHITLSKDLMARFEMKMLRELERMKAEKASDQLILARARRLFREFKSTVWQRQEQLDDHDYPIIRDLCGV